MIDRGAVGSEVERQRGVNGSRALETLKRRFEGRWTSFRTMQVRAAAREERCHGSPAARALGAQLLLGRGERIDDVCAVCDLDAEESAHMRDAGPRQQPEWLSKV